MRICIRYSNTKSMNERRKKNASRDMFHDSQMCFLFIFTTRNYGAIAADENNRPLHACMSTRHYAM